jgi:homoserine kinase type II
LLWPKLDRDELSTILSLYHLDGLEDFGDLPGGMANRSYWVRVNGRRYWLRLSARRKFADLLFEKELLAHLRQAGLPVPRVVENVASGAFTPWDARGRYVWLFEDTGGRRLGVFELRARHTRAIGDFLARMHRTSTTFAASRESEFDLYAISAWSDRLERARRTGRLAKRHHPDLARVEAQLDLQLRRRMRGAYGIIHGDLFVGNARFRGEQLAGVLDFERACRERLSVDLAVAINTWCWVPAAEQRGGPSGSFHRPRVKSLLGAYQGVRKLSEIDKKELAEDLKLVAVRSILTRMAEFELRRPAGLPYKDYRHFLARLDALTDGGAEELVAKCL